MPLLLGPHLVMYWLVMHALAKDSPGWLGDLSVTDLPCVHAIYREDHHRQTMDSCKKLMVSVCIHIYVRMQTFCNRKLYNIYTKECYNYMHKGKLYVYKDINRCNCVATCLCL